MDALAVVALLQKPAGPRFANADAVDRYYQAYDPGNQRPLSLRLVSILTVVGLLLLDADLSPR
jgi:hypothetical protein